MKTDSCFIEWTWRFQWTWISPEPDCCHPVNFVVIGCPRGCLLTPGQSMTTKLTTADEKCYFSSWWRHQMETFSALLVICAGNSPVPVNSPHKGQWRGALMFTLICVWINDWVNNRDARDLRRRRPHYDVTLIFSSGVPHHVYNKDL